MISKERLEELIEKEAYIWVLYGKDIVKMCTLDVPSAWKRHDCYKLKDLYETQSEAEWVAKMHAQRTEYFDPPTWEELQDFIEKFPTMDSDIATFMQDNLIYDFIVNYGEIYIFMKGIEEDAWDIVFEEQTTKDNYIKACEFARNLFLGKENENETDSNR